MKELDYIEAKELAKNANSVFGRIEKAAKNGEYYIMVDKDNDIADRLIKLGFKIDYCVEYDGEKMVIHWD